VLSVIDGRESFRHRSCYPGVANDFSTGARLTLIPARRAFAGERLYAFPPVGRRASCRALSDRPARSAGPGSLGDWLTVSPAQSGMRHRRAGPGLHRVRRRSSFVLWKILAAPLNTTRHQRVVSSGGSRHPRARAQPDRPPATPPSAGAGRSFTGVTWTIRGPTVTATSTRRPLHFGHLTWRRWTAATEHYLAGAHRLSTAAGSP